MHYQRARHGRSPRVRRSGCLVENCTKIHFGSGYCRAHYSRHRRGKIGPQPCESCRTPFERPLGKASSYHYCPTCSGDGPAGWAQIRRDRLTLNNTGMTEQDHAESRAYRALLAGDPCVYCLAPAAAVDHIVPVVRGGSDRWHNLAAVCASCNSSKGARDVLAVLSPFGV